MNEKTMTIIMTIVFGIVFLCVLGTLFYAIYSF